MCSTHSFAAKDKKKEEELEDEVETDVVTISNRYGMHSGRDLLLLECVIRRSGLEVGKYHVG